MSVSTLTNLVSESRRQGFQNSTAEETVLVPNTIQLVRELPFSLVDVFAKEPLCGNPLAVVMDAENLSVTLMQKIAREFNQSETTFILRPNSSNADWLLRSFTANGTEVFGAGHNALGAWWWLAESRKLGSVGGIGTFRQQIGERVLPVEVKLGIDGGPILVTMTQVAPTLGRIYDDSPKLAGSLGLSPAELAVSFLPAQVVSTGAPHLLVPLTNFEAVDRVRPNAEELLSVLQSVGGQGCYVFSLGARHPQARVYSRFFNPTAGIWEDPGTGSAAGPLAFQLTRNGIVQEHQDLLIEQGTAIGRTSLISVRVASSTVRVSGAAVTVAAGSLRVQIG
jgi:trans-2,3-dihydro-3-hydroxyanthranilate isomerase